MLIPFSNLSPALQRMLIEGHHVGGWKAGNLKVPLCRNHHAKASDWQYDWNERQRNPETQAECASAYTRGHADLLRLEADALEEAAQELLADNSNSSMTHGGTTCYRSGPLLFGTDPVTAQGKEAPEEAPGVEGTPPRRARSRT
jgi:hypothetical protein